MIHIDSDTLLRYIHGNLPEDKMVIVEEWLNATPENQLLLKKIFFAQQASDDLRLLDAIDPNKAWEHWQMAVNQKKKKRKLKTLRQIAAVLLIPLLLYVGYLLPRPSIPTVSHLIEVTTNPGVVTHFKLPDSTRVWLNAGSKLSYPSDFSRTNRWVALDGEGCFVVNKTKTPFVVKIDSAYSIKVLGTTFNVQAYADDGYIKTTLLNGSVQLNYLSSNNLGHVCFLKESEASLYSRERRTMNIGITDVNVDIAWKYGRIFFDNHSLRQALRVLSRHYNVDFKVLNENVYKSAITGKFDNEQLHQVLNYISRATGIKYKFIKPVITPNGMSKQEIILYK